MTPDRAAALAEWLATVGAPAGPSPEVRRLTGGQSNPTFLVEGPAKRLVVRCRPWGPLLPTAHAVHREFAVLRALHPTGFPVPRPLRLCLDETVIGVAFYVMEHVEGRCFREAALPGLAPEDRSRAYDGLARTLGRLHALDVRTLGLADFGPGDGYFERQLRRWRRQHLSAEASGDAEMERLADALARTRPVEERPSLVHGDYRIDNVLFSEDLAPRAVIDWELATLGDGLSDLAYLLMHWRLPADGATQLGGLAGRVPGFPDEAAIVRAYCEGAGRTETPDLAWRIVFNLFRATAICAGIGARVRNGTAAAADAAEVAARAPALRAAALDEAGRAGIL